jgi:hypothetical protein
MLVAKDWTNGLDTALAVILVLVSAVTRSQPESIREHHTDNRSGKAEQAQHRDLIRCSI